MTKDPRTVLVLVLAAVLLAPPLASAQRRPSVESRVLAALTTIDSGVPASFWRGLGPEGLATLERIVLDRSRPVGLRRRAVVALRHDTSERSRALLSALARDEREDEIVSRHALRALAERDGATAVPSIERALVDRRGLVREGAALVLASLVDRGVIDGAHLARLIEPALSREPELFVRVAMERALGGRGARSVR